MRSHSVVPLKCLIVYTECRLSLSHQVTHHSGHAWIVKQPSHSHCVSLSGSCGHLLEHVLDGLHSPLNFFVLFVTARNPKQLPQNGFLVLVPSKFLHQAGLHVECALTSTFVKMSWMSSFSPGFLPVMSTVLWSFSLSSGMNTMSCLRKKEVFPVAHVFIW